MPVHVILAIVGILASDPTEQSQERVTLASTVERVAKVCRLFVEKDGRDVRTFEERLGHSGADFEEITRMRLMCELYARGRDDASAATPATRHR